jgi:phospholipid transport system substrate-binding protein
MLRRRFPFLIVVGFAALVATTLSARPVDAADDAASFIAQAADTVLALARDRGLSQEQFTQRLRAIAEQDFDAPRIAKFVLGRYWRTASEADRQQFIQAFKDYMVQVYASRFRDYSGANFKVIGQRQEGDTSLVTTQIERSNGAPPATVVWQVVKRPEGYKITDVIIEGVSQALTYRDEFDTVIAEHDGRISALTQQLRQKANG